MIMLKRGFMALGLSLVLGLTVGCQDDRDSPREPAAAREPRAGGTAVIAFPAEPDVLNSLIYASAYTGQILALLQDGLLEMGEDLEWRPKIAQEWHFDPARMTLTYRLRPWRWSDGTPFSAYDVSETFKLFCDPQVGSPRRGSFASIAQVVAVDSATVRYEFRRPVADPLGVTVHAVLPAHLVSQWQPAQVRTWPLNERPVSSGAFVLEKWDRNQELVLARNELYAGAKPFLDRVVFRIIPDETARVVALETGEADFMEEVPVHAAGRVAAGGKASIYRVSGRLFGYLSWNFRNPLFADRRVRQAISLAIDRRRLIDNLMEGYATPAASPLPPALWAHNADVSADPYDPEAARRLLAEAGWLDRDGDGVLDRDGRRFSFEILTRQGDPIRENGVVIIRENLHRVGIEANPRVLEHGTAIAMLQKGRFDAYLGLFQANLSVDPSSLLHSEATDRFNYGGYANAQVDSLLQLALSLADRRRAKPVWDRLQEILAEDRPMAFLYYPETLIAVSHRLQDVRPHLLSPYNNICEWWIKADDRRYAGSRP
jgi:peptide/nickel transport system substrate-binding protein